MASGLDERSDRRPALPQRAHGRATPVEHLREAASVGEGGSRRRGRPLRSARRARAPVRALTRRYVQPAARGRPELRVGPDAGVIASPYRRPMEQKLTLEPTPVGSVQPVATHEIRGGGGVRLHAREWGNRSGRAILFIHGWSQCDACWTKQVSGALAERFRIVTLDIRGPRPVGEAHRGRALRRRAGLGGRRRGGDRSDRSRAPATRGVVLRRLHRDRLCPRLRRCTRSRVSISWQPP